MPKPLAADILPTISPDERAWLGAYRNLLVENYPDLLVRLAIYGSKARGDATEESDLNVLVILRRGDFHLKREVCGVGYMHDLAAFGEVSPAIMAYTQAVWEDRCARGNPLQQAVEREAVAVYG